MIISDICSKIGSGSTPKGSNYSFKGIPFFRSQNVYNEGLIYDDIKYISEDIHHSMIGTEVIAGDLLLNITGGSLGRCAVVPADFIRGNVSQHVCILRPIIVNPQYFHCLMLSSDFAKAMNLTGSGREGLPKYNLEVMNFPLPPIEEQERIVATVHAIQYILSFIDSSRMSLIDGIAKAKSKILDLAMQGKLVPQEPADEPAAEMLRRINPKAKIITDNPHYILRPKGWIFSELYNVSRIIMGQSPNGDSINNVDGIEFHQGKMYFGDIFLSVSPDKTNSPTKVIDGENILLSVRAPVGAVNKCNRKICIGRGLAAISPSEVLDETFLFYFFQFLRPEFEAKSTGSTFKAITGVVVKSALIPIPPINEQRRIVARVMELYSVLDEIEVSLRS